METTPIKSFKEKINPFLLVIITLLSVIIVGSLLLFFDYANSNNWSNLQFTDYIDSFFIAVSATCVTGLSVYGEGIVQAYSFFGQVVIALLIQIGGLGFMTIFSFIIVMFSKKLGFKDRLFISQAVGSNSVAHVGKFVKKVILISFTCETLGFLLGLPVFINLFPDNIGLALWNSLFHSISAYNNAGFDILGNQSLIVNDANTLLNSAPTWVPFYLQILTMILVVVGGLGFIVVAEIFSFKKKPSQYSGLTKIVLSTTVFLIVIGSLLFGLFECTKTINPMTPLDAIFQSITCRTAGFSTYDQSQLSVGGRVVSCFLMFIGGSPISTAGGVKTTTLFMILLAMYAYVGGKRVSAFKRSFSSKSIIKAMSLVFISFITILVCYSVIFVIEENNSTTDSQYIFFEAFSAFGTVGLSANLTPNLHWGSKLVLCILMFLGRSGPMTMFSIFSKNIDKEDNLHFKYVQEDVLIG